jgi:hypothetical protein
MAEAMQLAALHGTAGVNRALGQAAAGSPSRAWPRSWRTRPARVRTRHAGPANSRSCSAGRGAKLFACVDTAIFAA